ncbi:MAG TPA: hypothetical protein VK157_14055 [Phycisphaerales bacterium]|nr:hypothetical protein [Phycisphaerales bacterium]
MIVYDEYMNGDTIYPALPTDKTGVTALIGHADRVWRAAEANGTRLATRSSVLITATSGLLGLKLFALGKEWNTVLASDREALQTLFILAGVLSLICLTVALVLITGTRFSYFRRECKCSDGLPFASGYLELPPEVGDEPWNADTAEAVWSVYVATYDAGRRLEERNIQRKAILDRAGSQLFLGFVFMILSMLFYAAIAYNVSGKGGSQHANPDSYRRAEHFGDGAGSGSGSSAEWLPLAQYGSDDPNQLVGNSQADERELGKVVQESR